MSTSRFTISRAVDMAMKIGGENDPDAVQKRYWQQFAEEIGVKPRFVLTRIVELANKILDVRLQLFKEAFAPYTCDALYRLMQLLGDQAEKVIRRMQ